MRVLVCSICGACKGFGRRPGNYPCLPCNGKGYSEVVKPKRTILIRPRQPKKRIKIVVRKRVRIRIKRPITITRL